MTAGETARSINQAVIRIVPQYAALVPHGSARRSSAALLAGSDLRVNEDEPRHALRARISEPPAEVELASY